VVAFFILWAHESENSVRQVALKQLGRRACETGRSPECRRKEGASQSLRARHTHKGHPSGGPFVYWGLMRVRALFDKLHSSNLDVELARRGEAPSADVRKARVNLSGRAKTKGMQMHPLFCSLQCVRQVPQSQKFNKCPSMWNCRNTGTVSEYTKQQMHCEPQ